MEGESAEKDEEERRHKRKTNMASSAWLLNPAGGNELVAVSSEEPQSYCHPAGKKNLFGPTVLSLPLR